MKKITFKKGISRINFPILYPKDDFRDDIRKIMELKLPKYQAIGFEARYYEGNKKIPAFSSFEVFIIK